MNIPSYKQIYNDIVSDIETEFGITLPSFGKNYLRSLAIVQAAKIWLIYILLGKVQKNIFVDTADPEAQGGTLERFGRVKLGRNPYPAQAGEYEIEVTGEGGTTIPSGTTWQSDDDATNPGINYVLDSSHTISGTGTQTNTITVRALTPGTDGQQVTGDTITLTSPIAQVEDQAEITQEATTPVEPESIEEYRRQAIEAYRIEPQGGAAADFRLWSLDADGVRTSYPYTVVGDATDTNLEIFVEALPANTESGSLQGTPPNSMITAVEDVIEKDPDTTKPNYKRGRVPLSAFHWEVKKVEVLPVEIVINDYDDPGNHESEIEAAIRDRLYQTRPFVAAIDSENQRQDIFNKNNIVFEIQNINPRIRLGAIELYVDGGNDINSYQFGVDMKNGTKGEIPVLKNDNITFNHA